MTMQTTHATTVAADRELVAAARVLLQRMGVDPADLMQDPADRPRVPTFDEYIPQVEAAVSPRDRRHLRVLLEAHRREMGATQPASTTVLDLLSVCGLCG
jgi:hypothetical protein